MCIILALGGGVALATQGTISSALHRMRPTTMKRGYNNIKRDARIAGQTASASYRATKAAYLRRFGER